MNLDDVDPGELATFIGVLQKEKPKDYPDEYKNRLEELLGSQSAYYKWTSVATLDIPGTDNYGYDEQQLPPDLMEAWTRFAKVLQQYMPTDRGPVQVGARYIRLSQPMAKRIERVAREEYVRRHREED